MFPGVRSHHHCLVSSGTFYARQILCPLGRYSRPWPLAPGKHSCFLPRVRVLDGSLGGSCLCPGLTLAVAVAGQGFTPEAPGPAHLYPPVPARERQVLD